MAEEERTDYALFELNKLLKYVVYPEDVACIYMEPVMGEGGYVVPSRKFVQSVREICDKHGIFRRNPVWLRTYRQNVGKPELRRCT